MRPQVEKWAEAVRNLAEVANRHPQMAYAGLGMSLQLKWKYLQRTVPVVESPMELIKSALREDFYPTLFGQEEVYDDLRHFLGHGVKRDGIGIPDPRKSAE